MASADDPDMQDVGRRITSTREALGWTAAHLARLAQIHRTELYHLEKGAKAHPSAAVMWRVSQALKVTFEELWTGRAPSKGPVNVVALAESLERRVTELEGRRSTGPRLPLGVSTLPREGRDKPGGRPSRRSPRSS